MKKRPGFNFMTVTRLALFLCSFGLQTIICTSPALARSPENSDTHKKLSSTFSVLACVSWWSHDAVGYHPAMFVMLENISGHDLPEEEIPFQGRFTDVRDGYITVAREYKRTPLHSHDRFTVLLRAPKDFELPIDSSLWPPIECKAMCRMPNKTGGEPEVEDLYTARLTQITLTDEDAHAQLIKQAERSPLLAQREMISSPDANAPASSTLTASKQNTAPPEKAPSHSELKLPKHLPKVGDDFYTFEQFFGKAQQFHAGINNSSSDLTWAHYEADAPLIDVYAGSRIAGKVDVAIITLTARAIIKENDILSLGKLIAGCKSSISVVPFAHSVRYLSGGRSEIMTTAIRNCKILSFKIQSQDNTDPSIAIFVSRLPGDPETALAGYEKQVDFLRF